MIVSDLKCGVNSNGEPIRWNQQQIMRNDNNGLSFEECIKHKGIVKIDIIYLLNGRFIESTNVYQIVIDGESNMDYSVPGLGSNLSLTRRRGVWNNPPLAQSFAESVDVLLTVCKRYKSF